jgi:hypothetical protein
MEISCLFCGGIVASEDSFCSNCGKKVIRELDPDAYWDVYSAITERNRMSELAERYRLENYPLDRTIPINTLIGGCFTLGYNLRETESCFAPLLNKDLRMVAHNDKTQEILSSDITPFEKTVQIALFKEENNEQIGLGPEVADYSVFGFETSRAYVNAVIVDYLEQIRETVQKFMKGSEKADGRFMLELVYRNITLGYCFRVAEEIVYPEGVPPA